MATTRKTDKPNKKEVRDELTFLDVRQAARDGQKVFDKFVITGRLLITTRCAVNYPGFSGVTNDSI
jgi:hypothetical protein